ncbi:amino acid ABC transporter permease [Limnobacter parvus]|uniref:Amino acid ABC transporter permease n=1 Tax=Limnobacter parvus TaxID=2939690 RepID=A0ABT1XJF4_9BURK|nr:amino acid ABC transporter permease [Limnobacter parvus]
MNASVVLNRFLWVALPLLLAPVVWALVDWAVFSAVFRPDLQACQQAAGQGACWGVVAEKWRVILFGRYPAAEQWRAGMVLVVWSLLLFATAARVFKPKTAFTLWAVLLPASALLLHGGFARLPTVPTALWGGLPLTLILSTVGFGVAFPLGLLLALGRQSTFAPVRRFCIAYIELLRALPLVTVLFLAAFVLPLWLPGDGFDLFTRVLFTIALFSAAYLAEVLRGGLQAVPQGQAMAAKALGLNVVQRNVQVVLPQAIKACLPSLINSFITLFKECSLVTIVALFELTGSLTLALAGDVQWRSFYLEGYLFIALLYWAYCFGLSKTVK